MEWIELRHAELSGPHLPHHRHLRCDPPTQLLHHSLRMQRRLGPVTGTSLAAPISTAISRPMERQCWPVVALVRITALLLLCVVLSVVLCGAVVVSSPLSPLVACSLSFAEWELLGGPLVAHRTSAHWCPADCPELTAAAVGPVRGVSVAVVRGSYPYSSDSAICLAAVHCGVLLPSLGGSVYPSRFYRHDWSGGWSQTIFPFSSSQGSLSNGLHSLDVLNSSYSVPSNGTEFSFTVRGRGELSKQKREAPFPPRWGHAHVAYPLYFRDTSGSTPARAPYRNYHLILGGFDGTAYLNDVWIAQPSDLNTHSDLHWTQLHNAPFTPRAHISTAVIVDKLDYTTFTQLAHVLFIGGQTQHRCGLHELGVCSNEVWDLQLNVSLSEQDLKLPQVTSYTWASYDRPFALLPFSARCGAGLTALNQATTIALVAGQLSYDDDSCTSAPTALNEVWLNDGFDQLGHVNLSLWRRDADAPFSTRRSQQREDALATLSLLTVTPSGGSIQLGCCALVGGFRILNLTEPGLTDEQRSDEQAAPLARIDALELYSDAWVCNAIFPPLDTRSPTCSWGWLHSASAVSPTTSVPHSDGFRGQRSYARLVGSGRSALHRLHRSGGGGGLGEPLSSAVCRRPHQWELAHRNAAHHPRPPSWLL